MTYEMQVHPYSTKSCILIRSSYASYKYLHVASIPATGNAVIPTLCKKKKMNTSGAQHMQIWDNGF